MKKVTLLFLFLLSTTVAKEPTYSLEMLMGNAMSAAETLRFKKDGRSDIVIEDAVLVTHPFTPPVYYGIRFAWDLTEEGAWEFEHNHMKLYLDYAVQKNANVQWFEITDGYNLFWVNKAWYVDGWVFRAGLGVVIAHPQITVYNETNYIAGWGAIPAIWQSGYRFAGYSTQGAVQKRFFIGENFFLSLEAKLALSYAIIPLGKTNADGTTTNNGTVVVPNKSIHTNFGLGYKF